jgi:putative GTP pyrophosphokinase
MNETEFIEKYNKEIPSLRAWGDYINSVITKTLNDKLRDSPLKDTFIRIPPIPRIKETKSIIAKAFWRAKEYRNPYDDITDKVGLRYVVLLVDHIGVISKIIENIQEWDYSLDRDFEQEKDKFPFIFDYQSVHYVLRNILPITHDNVTIPANTPCEVQIRTLLQHACSELTHDTIYKKEPTKNKTVHRSIAKSRALTESADDIFTNIAGILAKESQTLSTLLKELNTLYQDIQTPDYDEKSNVFILNAIVHLANNTSVTEIKNFVFSEKPALKDIISQKANQSFIYRQPIILLLYYLIQYQRENLKNSWPLPFSEIQPLFTDLGIALNPNT